MPNLYTTEEQVTAYLSRPLTGSELVLLDSSIEHLSSVIESLTHRSWSDSEVDESIKIYDGEGGRQLNTDDFTELVKFEVKDTYGSVALSLIDPAEFILYPLNKSYKQAIRLVNYNVPRGDGNIYITAKFSSGKVPADINMVCTALVGNWLSQVGQAGGGFKSENIEGYSYTLLTGAELDASSKALLATLDKWKKITL